MNETVNEVEVNPAEGEGVSSDVNWSDMALELEDGGAEVAVEGDEAVVEAPAKAPAETEVVGGEPPSVSPPEPAKPPVETKPVETPAQEPPVQPTQSYAEWRAQQLEGLTKFYALDEEMSAKLLTEPEVVLPQLAAKLHMEVMENALRAVQAAIPQWMQGYVESQERERSAEKLFFEVNPDLKDPTYRNAIFHMGAAYRQLNPHAPAEEAVKVIGNMVRSAFGIVAPSVQQQQSALSPAPVFTPVRGGGGAAAPKLVSDNPWAKMAEEFLNDS